MKEITFSLLALSAIAMSTSCQREEKTEQTEQQAMRFYASYDGDVTTKASTVFPTGNKATIIGYTAGAIVTSASPVTGTPIEATGGTSGSLSPASALYLPKGSYDFYSVSLNNTTPAGLTFTAGISGQLSNGVDYLWAKHASVNEGGTVIFLYTHKAVGMEINVSAGTGVSEMSITSIKFTPGKPDVSSKMSLSTGTIEAAVTKDESTSMNITAGKGTFIMVPLASQALNAEVTINATIGGTPFTGKVYTATIPAQAYTGGTYYTLNMTVSATSMSFTGAQVQDWTTQTISGATLTEQ
ncbi:MAG: fimbrillin family protein [Rikenellaceae bacterium]